MCAGEPGEQALTHQVRPLGSVLCRRLGAGNRLGDLAGLDASGADVHPLGSTTDLDTNALDIGIPATLGTTVRVAQAHAEDGFLIAYVADGGHCCLSLDLVTV